MGIALNVNRKCSCKNNMCMYGQLSTTPCYVMQCLWTAEARVTNGMQVDTESQTMLKIN